ncbi:MAG TPA: glutamine synthetase family protein [Spirochaetota bacterium]|nr:glutamine synthetase family protein [Spirochaetota bacterium]
MDNREYIMKTAHDNDVKFIRLWFTDILGFLKSFAITINELEDALEEGVRFDGSTIHGFVRKTENEMIAFPDIETFEILPWRPKSNSVARMFCYIYNADMTPYECDVRRILYNNLKNAANRGYVFYVGPEIEFFLFRNAESTEFLDRGGYFDLTPLDIASDIRRQMVLTLEEMGISVKSSHHEGAPSQHEIDLRHDDALTTADNIMTFKIATKEIAQQNNMYASFMPKPLSHYNGSGMHIHQSLFKDDKNIFYDQHDENLLSQMAKCYIAGLLKHAPEFFVLSNQWVNSYKRLHYGFEAPIDLSWSTNNPSSLVRITTSRTDKPNSVRVELRNPDPACNPYLLFAAILASGLAGIDNNDVLPKPHDLTLKKHEPAAQPLPSTIEEALKKFDKSQLMRQSLGNKLVDLFVENKYYELDQYNRHVTDYELNTYLPIL